MSSSYSTLEWWLKKKKRRWKKRGEFAARECNKSSTYLMEFLNYYYLLPRVHRQTNGKRRMRQFRGWIALTSVNVIEEFVVFSAKWRLTCAHWYQWWKYEAFTFETYAGLSFGWYVNWQNGKERMDNTHLW